MAEANWQTPFSAWAFGLLSLVTLTLAATGVYGLVAFTVRQRSRELAVRVALGAGRRELETMVLQESLGFLAAGVAGGVLLAFAGMRVLESLLFGVKPMDPTVVGTSVAIMSAVVLLASYLPARNVVRRQPLAVLGKE